MRYYDKDCYAALICCVGALTALLCATALNAQPPTSQLSPPGVVEIPNTGCSWDAATQPRMQFWNPTGLRRGQSILFAWTNLPSPPNCRFASDTFAVAVGTRLLSPIIPLDFLGMPPGCDLHVAPDLGGVVLTYLDSCSSAQVWTSYAYVIPDDPVFLGAQVFAQGFGFRTAGAGHYYVTSAVSGLIF